MLWNTHIGGCRLNIKKPETDKVPVFLWREKEKFNNRML